MDVSSKIENPLDNTITYAHHTHTQPRIIQKQRKFRLRPLDQITKDITDKMDKYVSLIFEELSICSFGHFKSII